MTSCQAEGPTAATDRDRAAPEMRPRRPIGHDLDGFNPVAPMTRSRTGTPPRPIRRGDTSATPPAEPLPASPPAAPAAAIPLGSMVPSRIVSTSSSTIATGAMPRRPRGSVSAQPVQPLGMTPIVRAWATAWCGWPHRAHQRMWLVCFLTVSGVTTSSRASSWLRRPAASSRSTRQQGRTRRGRRAGSCSQQPILPAGSAWET